MARERVPIMEYNSCWHVDLRKTLLPLHLTLLSHYEWVGTLSP